MIFVKSKFLNISTTTFIDTIDLSIIGELRLDSIDHICADITSLTNGFVWGIGKGLLGDLGDLDFSPVKNKARSRGDLNMIMNVLQLIGNDNNSNIISKAAYGIGSSNGIILLFKPSSVSFILTKALYSMCIFYN